MYKDELQTEIAKELTTYSDLDYDVATIVASIYIVLREKQSQEDALKYYSRRKADIPQKYRNPNGKHKRILFNKEKNGVPELPTTIILMDNIFTPPASSCHLNMTTYVKTNGYGVAFRYFLTEGVRYMTRYRINQMPGMLYPSVVLSAWGITPKFESDKIEPDTIREKASHINKLPLGELYKIAPIELLD